jgi:hypothetical protein
VLRIALGERARARVEEHFQTQDMVERTRGIYDRVLGRRFARR